MKSQIILMLTLLLLYGCGSGGKGSAQLEISRAFAAGNANFDGGLFIHGKNISTGKDFSVALTSGQKAKVDLEFGQWDIKAVGWDEGSPGKLLEGKVYCAFERVDFNTNNQALSLKVSKGKCFDSAFADTVVSTGTINEGTTTTTTSSSSSSSASASSGGGSSTPGSLYYFEQQEDYYTIKNLKVTTCGAMYNKNAPTQIRPRNPTLASNWCDDYPEYFKERPKSMQISLITKNTSNVVDKNQVIESLCIPAAVSGVTFQTSYRIPTSIPVQIKFFESSDCADLTDRGVYYFANGIDSKDSRSVTGFDKLVFPADSGIYLALPTPLAKRGTTPFITEIPSFRCGDDSSPTNPGYTCLTLPMVPNGNQYVLNKMGPNFIRLPNVQCGAENFSSPDGLSMSGPCEQNDEDAFIMIDAGGASDGDFTFTFEGTPYGVHIKDSRFNQVLREIMRLVGFEPNANILNSLSDSNDGDKNRSSGILGDLQEELSPFLLGGLFWDQQCTPTPMSAPIERTMSFNEKGKREAVRLVLANSPLNTTPAFIRTTNNPRATDTSKIFHRRLIIRKMTTIPEDFKTEKIIDIGCDNDSLYNSNTNIKIGRSEEYRYDVDGTEIREERKIVFWNTTNNLDNRIEVYSHDIQKNAGVLVSERSTFERAQRIQGSSEYSNFKVTRLNFEHQNNFERLVHDEYHHRIGYITHQNLATLNYQKNSGLMPSGIIFTNGLEDEHKTRVRYGTYLDSMYPQNVGFRQSNNGKHVWAYKDDSNLVLEYFDGATYHPANMGVTPERIDADISPDGSKAIVVAHAGTTIFTYIWDGGSWLSHTAIVPGPEVIKLKAAILNSGDFVYVAQRFYSATNFIYMNIGNLAHIPTDGIGMSNYSANGIYNTGGPHTLDDFEVGKNSNKLILVFNHLLDDSGTFTREVSACAFDYLTPCNPTQVWGITTGTNDQYINQLSMDTSLDGTKNTLSFSNTPTLTYRSYSLVNLGSWVAAPPILSTDYTVTQNGAEQNAYQLSSYDTAGAVSPVIIPYVAPIIPAFKMNLSSLKPAHMIQNVFTNKTTFENTK